PAGAFGASPAPAAPVTLAEQPPCPRCGAEFGRGAECESGCGQPRKSCVVCGTKIWAGALTCSAHSGQA
ncbi:MAG TPA: hypothetical protein VFO65_03515, partial [Acidimicrobiales bacterium]|nr:hypothetical protein [Acidimicrobiales bacterium]